MPEILIVDYVDLLPTKSTNHRSIDDMKNELIRLRKSFNCEFVVPDHRTGKFRKIKFDRHD